MSTEYVWMIELKDTSCGVFVVGRGIGRMVLVEPTHCQVMTFKTKEDAQGWLDTRVTDKKQYHVVEHGFG